jgi:predicted DNA-binding transcriptional regulator AlpA|tara:strand:+ start:16 stop:231 length:216 start_codon:yes stop_codon:yes gene_type:complete
MDRSIPQTGFLRLRQIVGDKTQGIPPIIPVSKSTWWAGVASGKFPEPVKLGPATTAWRAEDIQALIKELAG